MKLSEVEFPKVGDVCISFIGNLGKITKIEECLSEDLHLKWGDPLEWGIDWQFSNNDIITIEWENGNVSKHAHCFYDKVEYVSKVREVSQTIY